MRCCIGQFSPASPALAWPFISNIGDRKNAEYQPEFNPKTNTNMQALIEIGFTEKDFQLASKIIEMTAKSNKKMAESTELHLVVQKNMGAPPEIAKMIADAVKNQWQDHQKEAIQENDQLIELQYKLIRLKKLLAQHPGDMPG